MSLHLWICNRFSGSAFRLNDNETQRKKTNKPRYRQRHTSNQHWHSCIMCRQLWSAAEVNVIWIKPLRMKMDGKNRVRASFLTNQSRFYCSKLTQTINTEFMRMSEVEKTELMVLAVRHLSLTHFLFCKSFVGFTWTCQTDTFHHTHSILFKLWCENVLRSIHLKHLQTMQLDTNDCRSNSNVKWGMFHCSFWGHGTR